MAGEEFGRMTPRQLFALMDQYVEMERRIDLRFGQVCAVIAASNGAKDVTAETFFPDPNAGREVGSNLLQKVELLNARFGGQDLRKDNGSVPN